MIAAGCASCPRLECGRPGCSASFCYHCQAEWHPNQTCDAARSERLAQFRPSAGGQQSPTSSLSGTARRGTAVHGIRHGVDAELAGWLE